MLIFIQCQGGREGGEGERGGRGGEGERGRGGEGLGGGDLEGYHSRPHRQ